MHCPPLPVWNVDGVFSWATNDFSISSGSSFSMLASWRAPSVAITVTVVSSGP